MTSSGSCLLFPCPTCIDQVIAARDASAQVEASHIDLAPEEIQPERVPETSVAVENAKEKVEERAEETGVCSNDCAEVM